MHSKSMHPAMFLKVKLGVVRALKNVETTYLLNSNNKSEKTQQSCRKQKLCGTKTLLKI